MLLDVRQVIETDDGAIIYVTYRGRCDRSRGTYTVAPTFETSDERYSWLNAVQAIGKGGYVDGRMTYEMFEVRYGAGGTLAAWQPRSARSGASRSVRSSAASAGSRRCRWPARRYDECLERLSEPDRAGNPPTVAAGAAFSCEGTGRADEGVARARRPGRIGADRRAGRIFGSHGHTARSGAERAGSQAVLEMYERLRRH